MAICPKCGSNKFHYELRSAGTRSKSNYYKTGFDDNWVIPAGQKTYKSDRRQKAIGFCPDCGYVEDKQPQQKSGWFYLLCFLFWPVSLSVWFYKTDLFHIDRKWRALIIAICWIPILVASSITSNTDVSTSPGTDNSASLTAVDYADANAFEAALNAGKDTTGKTVRLTVIDVVSNTAYGYNIWAGEHLNFCSENAPNVAAGDMIVVEVIKVTNVSGSYIIEYKFK